MTIYVNSRSADAMLDEGMSLLQDLVEIRSPSGQEGPAVNYLVEWMARRGFSAHRDAAGNAVGILEGPSDNGHGPPREIVLLGHIDTVPGFPRVTVRGGKLYGRGAVDAKGPLVAFVTAAAMLGPLPGWRIVVVGAVEEESATSKGARHIAARRSPHMAVIGEPTGWQRVALGYKGRLLADVTIQRLLSHTAGPEPSAPEMAVAFWNCVTQRVAALNAGRTKVWEQVQPSLRSICSSDDGLLETVQMRLGFRLPLDVTPDQIKALLVACNDRVGIEFTGEECAYRAEKNTPLVRAFLNAIREQGGEPGFVVKTGTSDMNVVGPLWRCPIVAYGPGDSSLDHTPNEHVALDEWRSGVTVLAGMLQQSLLN
ncbi:MAG: [LysW]-lysine hydrolase [Anaerolineae bacterium]